MLGGLMMTKNQWSAMILVVVVLALAVGFLGGSLYEKKMSQSVEVNVSDDDMQVWLRKCRALRAGMDESRCVITGKIE
jgi:hypothetical protein